MDITEIIKIDLEVFNNISKMLQSKDQGDIDVALENIKNLNPSDEMLRLFLKKTTYSGRNELIKMIGQNVWSFNDLTMSELYKCIQQSKHSNKENLKIIYESLVIEHFTHLTEDFDFIDGKYTIKW